MYDMYGMYGNLDESKQYVLTGTTNIIIHIKSVKTEAELISGQDFNKKIKTLAGGDLKNIQVFSKSENKPNMSSMTSDNIISTESSDYPIYAWYEDGSIKWWREATTVNLNENAANMFSNLNKATSIDLSRFDSSNVTDMNHMFYECNGLTALDLINFDTSKVTDMSYMFCDCRSLTTLNVENFDTSKVTRMDDMFYGCSSLSFLNVENFNTSNVTNMKYMFRNCANITTLNLSGFTKIPSREVFKCDKQTPLTVINPTAAAKSYDYTADNRTVTFKDTTLTLNYHSGGATVWNSYSNGSGQKITGTDVIVEVEKVAYNGDMIHPEYGLLDVSRLYKTGYKSARKWLCKQSNKLADDTTELLTGKDVAAHLGVLDTLKVEYISVDLYPQFNAA